MAAATLAVDRVILACALLVVCAALLLLIRNRGFGRLTLRAGPLSVDLSAVERIDQAVQRIESAVNHVEPGTPPIPERLSLLEAEVTAMRSHAAWERAALAALAEHVGAELPPPQEA